MAFFQEPRSQPFLRAPAAVLGLIALLVAAHIARLLAPAERAAEIIRSYAFIPARYSQAYLAAHGANPGTLFERALPFVSYIFLHADFGHLAVNSVWLLAFGSIVARRFGAMLFFALFLLCGIAGAGTYLALNWGSTAYVIGASGAISGLMGAGFRMMAGSLQPHGPPKLGSLLSRQVLTWTAVWVGVNLLAGVTGLGQGTEVHLIAWQAHLGGYAAGLLLAGPFAAIRDRRTGEGAV